MAQEILWLKSSLFLGLGRGDLRPGGRAPQVKQAVTIDRHQRMAVGGEPDEIEASALPRERQHIPVRGDVPEVNDIQCLLTARMAGDDPTPIRDRLL